MQENIQQYFNKEKTDVRFMHYFELQLERDTSVKISTYLEKKVTTCNYWQ